MERLIAPVELQLCSAHCQLSRRVCTEVSCSILTQVDYIDRTPSPSYPCTSPLVIKGVSSRIAEGRISRSGKCAFIATCHRLFTRPPPCHDVGPPLLGSCTGYETANASISRTVIPFSCFLYPTGSRTAGRHETASKGWLRDVPSR
jgi:hypothetical protein